MKEVYIGLGSNMGDRIAHVRRALSELDREPHISVSRVSSLFLTAPQGDEHQAWFVNAVAEVDTSLPPSRLLLRLQSLENRMGRKRTRHWGPRNIDLDLLFFGGQILDEPDLTLPHPRAAERRFVMAPLAELAPVGVHPILRKTFGELLRRLGDEQPITPIGSNVKCDADLIAGEGKGDPS